eukprot:scaffold301540_cov22-Tisochrysis_lutea.AAC.1
MVHCASMRSSLALLFRLGLEIAATVVLFSGESAPRAKQSTSAALFEDHACARTHTLPLPLPLWACVGDQAGNVLPLAAGVCTMAVAHHFNVLLSNPRHQALLLDLPRDLVSQRTPREIIAALKCGNRRVVFLVKGKLCCSWTCHAT